MPPTPLADQATLTLAVDFCIRELTRYGLKSIFLIGSRASGSPRDKSDHDLLAVVSDSAPREIGTGQKIGMQIFEDLCREIRKAGVGPVDLVIQRQGHYLATVNTLGSFANATVAGGIKLV